MRKLPPLNALKAFEVAARLGGVRAAQKELNVTQSAISHQIAKLESFLGTQLFHRKANRLILTEKGRDLLMKVEPALDMLSQASQIAADNHNKETLTIAIPPSLLSHWLIPKISSYIQTHQDINIRFVEQLTLKSTDTHIDCAIEYRYQPNLEFESVKLMPDHAVPLCSPQYMRDHKLKTIKDISGCLLIETERRHITWQSILNKADITISQQILSFNYTMHALEAAKHGVGIALANSYNAQSMLDTNELVIPFEIKKNLITESPSYFLSAFKSKSQLPKVESFWQWLNNQVKY